MYTRNDWYVACAEDDLTEGRLLSMNILDEAIVVWRSGDGIAALEDRCVHRAAALSLGRCEGTHLRCMYHGLLFNNAGLVVEIRGQDIIPPNAKVRAYPVISRYNLVWVWMGDPAKADPGRLPALLPGVRFEDYDPMKGGVLDFKAEARLVSDNLLDFSHLSYVHTGSFQASSVWVDSRMEITQLERGVRFERWIENGGRAGEPSDTDHWLGYDYLIPGVLVMWGALYPKGTARAMNFGRPDLASSAGDPIFQIQTITPMSDRLSRYHFIAGLHRERADASSWLDGAIDLFYQAFNEDRVVIEAQQRVIDRDADRPVMPTVHDRGILLYNRLKARLVAEEQRRTEDDPQLTASG